MEARDGNGYPVANAVGTFLILRLMPSMLLYFWTCSAGTTGREACLSASGVSGAPEADKLRDIHHAVEVIRGILASLAVGVELQDSGYWMPHRAASAGNRPDPSGPTDSAE
jgi:hypothetical protein